MFLKEDHRKWDENLPEIQFAINNAVQDSTGYSPEELNFGRSLRTGNTVYSKQLPQLQKPTVDTAEMVEKVKDLCSLAKHQLDVASQQQAKYYNLRRRKWAPKVGEVVYKKNHYLSNAANAFAAKLAPSFSGQFTVVNFISPSVVELRGEDSSKKLMRAHLKDLKEVRISESSD